MKTALAFTKANLFSLIEKEAAQLANNAAYGGAMDDGGAGRLREQVKFYRAGAAGSIPDEWARFVEQLDPEWKEYERLREKFKNR